MSLTFCGRSTSVSVCAAGEGEAAGEAAALAFASVFAFMSEEQPASADAKTSAHARSMSRESFILSSCQWIADCGLEDNLLLLIRNPKSAAPQSDYRRSLVAERACAGCTRRPSTDSQSMLEKNASMYFGRSAGL